MAGNKIELILLGFFLFFFSSEVKAQKHPVFYVGFDYYRDTGFSDNMYGNLNVGAQVYQWKFFAPEVGLDLYAGWIDDIEIKNPSDVNAQPLALYDQDFSAALFTFSPKLKFGKDDAFLTFSPKYHIGTLKAKGHYSELMSNGGYGLEEQQKATVPVSFWSFAVGVEGLAIRTDSYWFTLSLHYTLLDVEKAFKELDFSEKNINSSFSGNSTLGLGVRFYWNAFSD